MSRNNNKGQYALPCSVPVDHAAGTKFGNFIPTHPRNSRASHFIACVMSCSLAMATDKYFPSLNHLSKNDEGYEIVYYN